MSRQITRRRFVTKAVAGTTALTLGASGWNTASSSEARALSGLDDYCRQSMMEWKVPGLALAIVRDGKLLLARGYGVRELGKAASVDEHTIFPIASCTKSFTAAVVGKLVDAGKIPWDDRIGKHLPGLFLPADDRSIGPTIRHALQHRSGLPAANMLWRSGAFDADEILRRVRFLEPVAAPGERFVYSNVMYLVAGQAAEHAGGKPWNDLVSAELLEPLGMKSTLPDSRKLADFDNVASPHADLDGQVKPIERYCPDVIAPAGAIHSTAADMAQWLILHLNQGRFGSHQILSADRVNEMQTAVESPPRESPQDARPQAPISHYGLGWFVSEHTGKKVVEHSGTQNGFVSWMAIMPEPRLGVVILSNHHQTGINTALRSWIFDRLLERPAFDWSSAVKKDYAQGWQKLLRDAKTAFDDKRPSAEPTSRPASDYAGTYESRLYGKIAVVEQAGKLRLKFGTRFQGELRARHGDTFRAFFTNPRLDDWLVTFATADEKVASLQVQEAPWAPPWYDDRDDLGIFERR